MVNPNILTLYALPPYPSNKLDIILKVPGKAIPANIVTAFLEV